MVASEASGLNWNMTMWTIAILVSITALIQANDDDTKDRERKEQSGVRGVLKQGERQWLFRGYKSSSYSWR